MNKKQYVVLLHGLARSNASMKKLERALLKEGFIVHNIAYPSTSYPIDALAQKAIRPVLEKCHDADSMSFVTHSMGGILLRQYLSQYSIPHFHRAVMLGPPNQGSEVVDKLGSLPGFRWLNGEAGLQLGTDAHSVPNQLGPVNVDVGVIAGTRSINLMLSMLIPGADDGKVSVERTKIAGMRDHITMPVTHPFMMKNTRVIEQVIYFLRHGEFKRALKI